MMKGNKLKIEFIDASKPKFRKAKRIKNWKSDEVCKELLKLQEKNKVLRLLFEESLAQLVLNDVYKNYNSARTTIRYLINKKNNI